MGLDWRAGDKIVAFREEFPANYLPLEATGGAGRARRVALDRRPLERIDQACRGARLLAISFVQYLSGHRADLDAIGEICRRHGCLFLVDAIQGLGAFPLDVRGAASTPWPPTATSGCSGRRAAASSTSAAGLAGPGRARRVRLDQRRRLQRLRLARHDPAPRRRPLRVRHAEHDRLLRPARGHRVSARSRRREHRRPPCRRSATGGRRRARARATRCSASARPRPAPASSASARRASKPRRSCASSRRNIIAAPRQGWVRVSPHFYIAPEDIDRMLEELT